MAVMATRVSPLAPTTEYRADRPNLLARFVDALKRSRQAAAEREVRRFVEDASTATDGPVRHTTNRFV